MGKKSRGSRGRRKSGRTPVAPPSGPKRREPEHAVERTSADSETGGSESPAGAKPENPQGESKVPPKGFARIPYWMRHEKGYSDFVAGVLVTLAGGAIIIIVSYILILVWPAQ